MNLWLGQPPAVFLASHTVTTCSLPTAKDRRLKPKEDPTKPVALAQTPGIQLRVYSQKYCMDLPRSDNLGSQFAEHGQIGFQEPLICPAWAENLALKGC